MTEFAHIELIINQYFNLANEIDSLIEKEEYGAVVDKLDDKDSIIKKLFLAQKTVNFSEEEWEKLQSVEQKIREYEQKTIRSLEKLQSEAGEELKRTNKKVKINSAYDIRTEQNQGTMINYSE